MNTKSNRGGARPGAGRKPSGRSHTVTVRLSDQAYNIYKSITNKTEYINDLIIQETASPTMQDIQILPRHKVALEHRAIEEHIWVVLLTTMPGDSCKAWRLTKKEYWSLQPKHGTRDRYIRENHEPTITGPMNPKQTSMF